MYKDIIEINLNNDEFWQQNIYSNASKEIAFRIIYNNIQIFFYFTVNYITAIVEKTSFAMDLISRIYYDEYDLNMCMLDYITEFKDKIDEHLDMMIDEFYLDYDENQGEEIIQDHVENVETEENNLVI